MTPEDPSDLFFRRVTGATNAHLAQASRAASQTTANLARVKKHVEDANTSVYSTAQALTILSSALDALDTSKLPTLNIPQKPVEEWPTATISTGTLGPSS